MAGRHTLLHGLATPIREISGLDALGHGLYERSEIVHFFQAATPNQFSFMHRNVRTAITHVLSSIRLKVNRLYYHETLDVGRAEQITWVGENSPHDLNQTTSHFLIDQSSQDSSKFSPGDTFRFRISEVGSCKDVAKRLNEFI